MSAIVRITDIHSEDAYYPGEKLIGQTGRWISQTIHGAKTCDIIGPEGYEFGIFMPSIGVGPINLWAVKTREEDLHMEVK